MERANFADLSAPPALRKDVMFVVWGGFTAPHNKHNIFAKLRSFFAWQLSAAHFLSDGRNAARCGSFVIAMSKEPGVRNNLHMG